MLVDVVSISVTKVAVMLHGVYVSERTEDKFLFRRIKITLKYSTRMAIFTSADTPKKEDLCSTY